MNKIFSTKVNTEIANKLKYDLIKQNFEIKEINHAFFLATKKGVSLTFYKSGKLVVQGKDKDEFIKYYLEPDILKTLDYSYPNLNIDKTPRMGIDESGKGDFFGPLCVAGVYGDGNTIDKLIELNVKDSKKLSDTSIKKIAIEIKKVCEYKIIEISPKKYNELYEKFKNLNYLLAWGHTTVIESLNEQTNCKKAIVDKFANSSVIESFKAQKKLNVEITQIHRAEQDIIVAAASILARNAFVEYLYKLEKEYNLIFPKGASKEVIRAGKEFINRYEKYNLKYVAKMHFKTLEQLYQSQ